MNQAAELLALQLLVFEMNWPTYKWIQKVVMRDGQEVRIYVEHAKSSPDKSAIQSCTEMFQEVFQAVHEKRKTLMIEYGFDLPGGREWTILMSDDVFKRLATEVAPWRLEAGR